MASAEKIVDYVAGVLSSLIPKPADILIKPVIKPVGDTLKAWLANAETQKALLEAARDAENDFRERARKKFGNDQLTQAVASFPLHNGELFQAALQSLPSHFNETFLETHLRDDLAKYWSGEFTSAEIRAGVALYIDCLRLRLLRVNGFAEVITRLAILRTDRRTENMEETLNEIREMLSGLLDKNAAGIVFRSLHQLPQPPADFAGREELIAQLLEDFEHNMVATITSQRIHGLTGMGGIGKTSLGLVVAHQVAKDYPDAQIFLDLKGTTTPLSAVDVMRHVILSFEPEMDIKTLEEAGMANAYRSVLHGKHVLLFLDNAHSAEQIAPLRPPETCALLVTSRWSFSVPGLHTRRLNVMSEENAMAFLLELCPRIAEGATELAKACAYLPLALRIAGSFLAVNEYWGVEEYLIQLNNRKQRLTTLEQSRKEAELTTEPSLQATFELSYSGLSGENQKHWRLLGVFPTSFEASAAAAMWELDPQGDEARQLLGLLLRYSLLDYVETASRYSLHDLLADYALSQMDDGEEVEAHLIHSYHYFRVLITANDLYKEGGEKVLTGLRLFDLEWENIRAGQAWVSFNSDEVYYLELCNEYPSAGSSILPLKLHPRNHIAWLDSGLEAAKKLGDKRSEGYHLGNLGLAYHRLGEVHKAIQCYEQVLVICRETGNRLGEGNTLGNLGLAYHRLGDVRKAMEFHEGALVIYRETGNRLGEGTALSNLGLVYRNLGETRKAIGFHEGALVIYREIGDRLGEGNVLGSLGLAYADLGEALKAIELYKGHLAIAREIGDRLGEGNALGNLGLAHADLGEAAKAIEFYEPALGIAREIGDRRGEGRTLNSLGGIYEALGDVRKAVEFHEQALVIARETSDRRGEGDALFRMGLALYGIEEKEQATHLMKQALQIYEAIESPNAEAARNAVKEWGALPEDK